jgi:large subunit ribosomal protein L4
MALSVTVQGPGDSSETVNLPAEIFDVDTNVALIHQVVVAQLAAARQGTASTKTRGEVRGGGKKPYRQKGTGRARQGSTRAPQFAGGGTVHGPKPRSYDQRTPKKMKAAALRGALSDRARFDRVHVVSSVVEGETPSTKAAEAVLSKVTDSSHVLVVAERNDALTWKSLRNLAGVHLLEPGQLNTYDVLISDDVVFTRDALEAFVAGPARGRSLKAVATASEAAAADAVDDADAEEEEPAATTESSDVATPAEIAVDEASGSSAGIEEETA